MRRTAGPPRCASETALAAAALHAEGRRVCEPSQARARRPAPVDRGNLIESGHPSWAAEHLELAAQASLDLDPLDRTAAEPAADALLGAGDRARRRTESRSAIDFYERALALGGPEEVWGVREARALAGMGEAHYWLGEYPAATEALDRAVDPSAPTSTTPSRWRWRSGSWATSPSTWTPTSTARRPSSTGRSPPRRSSAIRRRSCRTLLFAGWVPWTRGDTAEAEAIWRRALAVAEPDDGWARVRALNSLSINLTGAAGAGPVAREDVEAALRLSEEASAIAESMGDGFSIAIAAVQRARVLEDLGRREESLPCIGDAIATSTSWARGGSTPTPWRNAGHPARAGPSRRGRDRSPARRRGYPRSSESSSSRAGPGGR